jgi:succinate dehydrogenase/fumarate reductase flavoprotein subunit
LEVERGGGTKYGGVMLDLHENKQDPIGQRIKKAYETALKTLSDSVRFAYGPKAEEWDEPWDVFPSAHYFMGGVRIDVNGRCSHPKNLYAVGEVSGGLHGGNRLGSVSLAEIFLFGLRAGEHAGCSQKGKPVPAVPREQVADERERIAALRGSNGRYRPIHLVRQLQGTMWDCAGPVRGQDRLRRGERVLDEIEVQAQEMKLSSLKRWNGELVDALELSLMLPVARMVIRSANARTESRGAHIRLDFPQKDADRNVGNVIVRKSSRGEMAILSEPVSFSRLRPEGGYWSRTR